MGQVSTVVIFLETAKPYFFVLRNLGARLLTAILFLFITRENCFRKDRKKAALWEESKLFH